MSGGVEVVRVVRALEDQASVSYHHHYFIVPKGYPDPLLLAQKHFVVCGPIFVDDICQLGVNSLRGFSLVA